MYASLQSKLDQIRGVWRFRWAAMLVAWIVCLTGWLVVLALPDTYSAWAQVHIDPSTPLSWDTKDSNVDKKAEAVREELLGSPQLDKVARAAINGYAMASPPQQQRMLERLRKRLEVNTNEGDQRGQAVDLYTITYTDRDRLTAQRVVEQVLHQFLVNLQGGAQEESEEVQQVLKQQIAEFKERLQAAEARLVDFKRRNPGLLPGATSDYATRLQAAREQLEKLREALQVTEERRDALLQQLSGEPAAATAADIRRQEVQLRELRQRFTDAHPDVIAARRNLEELKAKEQEQIAAVRRGGPAATAAPCRGANEGNPEHQGICSQLSQADVDVATARRAVDVQKDKIAQLDKMIDTAPQVEADYAELNGDYENTRSQYDSLVKRLNSAKLSDQARAKRAVRFTVIQPPTGSTMPVSPNRPRLILVVLLAAVAAGVGMGYFMNELRPVFYSARQVGETISLPVLGIVGTTGIERRMAEERRALWAYGAAAGALVLAAAITLRLQSPTSHFIHGLMA